MIRHYEHAYALAWKGIIGLFTVLWVILMGSAYPAASASSTQGEGIWTNFSTADGLASNSILALEADGNGYLWAGTNHGLSVLAPKGTWLTLPVPGDSFVRSIVPDPSNPHRHWIATYDGGVLLDDRGSPFDPRDDQWVTFRKRDGLADNHVWTVAAKGSLVWFGHEYIDADGDEHGFGISVLDLHGTPFDKSDDSWRVYTTANSGLSHNVVRDIVVDNRGVVWIATQSGLDAYSGGKWVVFYSSDGLASNDVTDLQVAGNLLWVGTRGGVSVLDYKGTLQDKSDDRWATYTQYNSGLVDNNVSSVSVDQAGRVWVGTDQKSMSGETGSGVSVLDPKGTPFDSSDDAWVTFGTPDGLVHDAVRTVLSDGSNVVWFGTKEGLSRLQYGGSLYNKADDQWTSYTYKKRIASNSVYAVSGAETRAMWIGTDQGLNLLQYDGTPSIKSDDRWTTYTEDNGLASNDVLALAVDGSGRVWIGTTSGLTILDTRGTPAYKGDDISITYDSSSGLVNDQVNDILIDSSGRAWIACGDYFGGGLQVLDTGSSLTYRGDDRWSTFTPLNSGMPDSYVTSIAMGGHNDVWIGTHGGAARLNYAGTPFDKSDDTWTVFTMQNSGLAFNTVRGIAVDHAGNVWFGLAIGGLSARSSAGSWVTFTKSDGLAYNSVYTVFVDHTSMLWIGTDGGVSTLDYHGTLRDKSDDTWKNYGDKVLLSEHARSAAAGAGNTIWIGTLGGGASVYSPSGGERLYLPVVEELAW